jgi:uncharacterized repeat protein (TIGR01451 family)
MDQHKKKSKKIIKILFIFLAILVIALIGAIVYFSLSGDFFQEEEEDTITCGCYYIDPQVVNTCGDTKRAFKFNTAQGTLLECNASCPTDELSTNSLYSTTPQDSYLTCTTKNIPSTQCNAMEITTQQGLIVTGKIPPEESITVTATFDSDEYSDHKFLINSVPTDPDSVEGNTITKTISDFGDSSTMQIVAQASNSTRDTVSSIICNRLIEITTTAKAGVSELTLDTYVENNVMNIRSAIISAGGLQDLDSSLTFSFEDESLTMVDGFEIDPDRGRISIAQAELYDSENFSESESFSLFSNYEGEIEITVEVVQDGNSLGTATARLNLGEAQEEEPTGEEEEEEEEEEQEEEEENEEEVPNEEEVLESSFSVRKESSVSCVERVSPNNTADFTITITNNGSSTDTIESIKDKLPLGFTYVAGSSQLDGNPIADSVFVTTTDVGESQEIVWEPQDSWSIGANGTLVITFEATAGSNALTGANLNEVIVTPSEIPEDPSTLRTSTELTVAQDCENIEESTPETGIFDTTLGRITVGIGIILTGIIIYNTHQGNRLAQLIVNSGPYKGAEMTSYRIFNPKRYFEEKILERRERER